MKRIELENINCDICDSKDTDHFFTIAADPGWKIHPQEFSYVRCKKCELLYLNPRPKEDALFEYYNQETVQTDKKVKAHVSAYFHNYILHIYNKTD